MLFPKELLIEVLWGDEVDYDGVIMKHVDTIDEGTSRWESQHTLIFSYDEKLYSYWYSKGLTENQEHWSYEDDPDMIECPQVIRIPVTTYEYKVITGL